MDYDYGDDIKKRLRRIEGQIRGVLSMMEQQKSCKEVVAQLTAIRNASDKAIAQIVAENLQRCLREEQEKGGDTSKVVQEAVELLVKSR
ncbi:metal-sensitive transcriptional regulator [Brevibacillus migulae]|uniref:metal-sensitive transcriptional regulator n=1 Tax=Brevibacillus migulae TaxID=1644114 RepID=UPI00106EA6AC|nr:metal-sensitive transcriptional regulator [Brevibacillus migulae]